MEHKEFKIGMEFIMSRRRWRCTDVGTRVIVAIKLDRDDGRSPDGPPYMIEEMVIDEFDQDSCYKPEGWGKILADNAAWGILKNAGSEPPREGDELPDGYVRRVRKGSVIHD